MTTKIIILTTEGGGSEDANVYYATPLIVSSDTLNFDEKVFDGSVITVNKIPGLEDDFNEDAVDQDKLIEHIQGLGYQVDRPEFMVITTGEN